MSGEPEFKNIQIQFGPFLANLVLGLGWALCVLGGGASILHRSLSSLLAVGLFGFALSKIAKMWIPKMPVILEFTANGLEFPVTPWQPSPFMGQTISWSDIEAVDLLSPTGPVPLPVPKHSPYAALFLCLKLKSDSSVLRMGAESPVQKWAASLSKKAGAGYDIVLPQTAYMFPLDELVPAIRSHIKK